MGNLKLVIVQEKELGHWFFHQTAMFRWEDVIELTERSLNHSTRANKMNPWLMAICQSMTLRIKSLLVRNFAHCPPLYFLDSFRSEACQIPFEFYFIHLNESLKFLVCIINSLKQGWYFVDQQCAFVKKLYAWLLAIDFGVFVELTS